MEVILYLLILELKSLYFKIFLKLLSLILINQAMKYLQFKYHRNLDLKRLNQLLRIPF